MKIGDFFVELFLRGDGTMGLKVRDLVSKFGDLQVATAGEILSLEKLAERFIKVAADAAMTAQAFGQFEAQTGLSALELQKWQNVAEDVGISADTVASSIQGIQQATAQLRLGQGDISGFKLLGLNPNDDAFKILKDIMGGKINKYSAPITVDLLKRIGVSPQMIPLLKMTRKEFDDLNDSTVLLNRGQLNLFKSIGIAFGQLSHAAKAFGHSIVTIMGPLFINVLHVITRLLDGAVSIMAAFNERIEEGGPAIKTLALAFGVLLAVTHPILAAFTALLLILDDIAVYSKGGKSLIGDALKGLEGIKKKPLGRAMTSAGGLATFLAGSAINPLAGMASQAAHVVQNNTQNVTVNTNAPGHETANHWTKAHGDQTQKAYQQIKSDQK